MPNIKTKKMSLRIPLRLYQMIQDLLPLFDYNETAVVVYILKNYDHSEDHQKQFRKLQRAHFIAYHRDLEMRRKREQMKGKNE